MQEKPKTGPDAEPKPRNADDGGLWEDDQRERSYYYDDAHGYEVYVPDDENEDEETRA